MIVAPGSRREHVRGEQHQLPVRIDDWPPFVTTPSRSPSPSKASPSSASSACHRAMRSARFFGMRRIGVVVGKRAVDVAVRSRDVAAEPAEERPARTPATPLPASMRSTSARASLMSPTIRSTYAASDVLGPIAPAPEARSPRRCASRSAWMSAPDSVSPAMHHLEPVVVGRIVAAGHHHAALGREVLRREVESSASPPCRCRSRSRRRRECRRRSAPASSGPDSRPSRPMTMRVAAAFLRQRADRPTDRVDVTGVNVGRRCRGCRRP